MTEPPGRLDAFTDIDEPERTTDWTKVEVAETQKAESRKHEETKPRKGQESQRRSQPGAKVCNLAYVRVFVLSCFRDSAFMPFVFGSFGFRSSSSPP
jgi:hypothetical protein